MFKKFFVLSALAALSSTAFGGSATVPEKIVKDCRNTSRKMTADRDEQRTIKVTPRSRTAICMDETNNDEIRNFWTARIDIKSDKAQTVAIYQNVGNGKNDCERKTKNKQGYRAEFRVKRGNNTDLELFARGRGIDGSRFNTVCYTPFTDE